MSQTIVIRPAAPADVSRVDALLSRSYPALLKADYAPSVMVTAVPLISRARPELLASGTYYVAETEAGNIVGAGGWTRANPRSGGQGVRNVAHVRHMVTDHRMIRQGIARRILNKVFEDAMAAGIVLLDCLSTRTAVPFYMAMGFVPLEPVEIDLRAGIVFPAIQMQRHL